MLGFFFLHVFVFCLYLPLLIIRYLKKQKTVNEVKKKKKERLSFVCSV